VRKAVRAVAVAGLVLGGLFAWAGPASAHPLGNFTINLYSGLVVEPGRLHVNYVLDMAEIPTFQEMPRIDADGDGTASPAERAAYAAAKARELVRGVSATVGGKPVVLHVVSSAMRFRPGQGGLPILRLEAEFAGAIPTTGTLEYREGNYAGRIGWREITAVGADGAAVRGSDVPARSVSDALLSYPTSLLKSPLHVTTATLRFQPGATGAAPALPSSGGSGRRPGITGGAFARLATWTGISVPVFLLALLLAMGFGAAHALLPGHGKTIMAAYLVGAGGRMKQAVQVGLAVALMHTASVLGIGLVVFLLAQFAPEQVYPWITLASGLLVIGLGAGLLITRLRSRAASAHAHPHAESATNGRVMERELVGVGALGPAGARLEGLSGRPAVPRGGLGGGLAHEGPTAGPSAHHHPRSDGHGHGHSHQPPDLDRPLSRRSLAGLAVAGGILPSPTALVVLVSTVSAHRAGFGLSLIVAFSVGLAGALVAVGILALRAREAVSRRLSGRFLWLVSVASAAVIVGVGVFLAAKGALQV
jgi:nickel/cobalt exporter